MEYYYSLAYPPCSLSVKFSHNCHDLFSVDDFFLKAMHAHSMLEKCQSTCLMQGFHKLFNL